MKYGFMTHATQTCVAVHNLNLFSDNDITEDWEEGEHRRHSRLAIDYEERNMVDLQAIRQVSNPSSTFVSMCYDNDLMPTVYKLR